MCYRKKGPRNTYFSMFVVWNLQGSFPLSLFITSLPVSFYVEPGAHVRQELGQWPRPNGNTEKGEKKTEKNEGLEILVSRAQNTGGNRTKEPHLLEAKDRQQFPSEDRG